MIAASNGSSGGSAARVTGNLTVSPGDVLTLTVAAGGVRPTITGVEVPPNATGGGACYLGSSLQNGTVASAGNGSARTNVRRPGSIVISY